MAVGQEVCRPPAEVNPAGSGAKTDRCEVSNTPGTDSSAANEA